jgi:hypothetical protein
MKRMGKRTNKMRKRAKGRERDFKRALELVLGL